MSASTKRRKKQRKLTKEEQADYQRFVNEEIRKVEDNLNKFYAVHDKAATKPQTRAVVNWAVGDAKTLTKGITRLNSYLMNTYGANLERGRERGRNDECVKNCHKIDKRWQKKRNRCFRKCFQKRRWADYFGKVSDTITKRVFREGSGSRRHRRRSHRRRSHRRRSHRRRSHRRRSHRRRRRRKTRHRR